MLVGLFAATVGAAAQTGGAKPTSPVYCDAFRKNQNGSWTATRNVMITVGSWHVNAGADTTYALNAINMNGLDFAAYLDSHCDAAGK
jgi:hypothetical protein